MTLVTYGLIFLFAG